MPVDLQIDEYLITERVYYASTPSLDLLLHVPPRFLCLEWAEWSAQLVKYLFSMIQGLLLLFLYIAFIDALVFYILPARWTVPAVDAVSPSLASLAQFARHTSPKMVGPRRS